MALAFLPKYVRRGPAPLIGVAVVSRATPSRCSSLAMFFAIDFRAITNRISGGSALSLARREKSSRGDAVGVSRSHFQDLLG